MTDTIRSQYDLLNNLFQDGQPAGSITPQSMRDFIVSAFGAYSTTQTADYTAQITDQGTTVNINAVSGVTFEVPPNASVAFPVGAIIEVRQTGAGQVRVLPGSTGVTLSSPTGAFTTRAQWSKITLTQESTDNWSVGGDVSEPPRFLMGDSNGLVWSSDDGQHWASCLWSTPIGASAIFDVKWVSELGFYAVIDYLGNFFTTTDGINWTKVVIAAGQELDSFAYHGGVFVVAGNGGTQTLTYYSLDGGVTWTRGVSVAGTQTFISMENPNGLFIGGSANDDGRLFTSPDGRTWTQNAFTSGGANDNVSSISYNPLTNRYIACLVDTAGVLHGRVFTSDGGLSWNVSGYAFPNAVSGDGAIGARDSLYADGMFLVCTGNFSNYTVSGVVGAGHLFYSTDNAVTWNDVGDITGKGYSLMGIEESEGVFVAMDGYGNVYRSLASVVTSTSGWTPVGNIAGLGATINVIAARP